jgi:hypothetical protein
MVNVLQVITDAYELYKENWRSIITAFAVLFLIALVFGLVNFFAQLPSNFICDHTNNVLLVLIFCLSPAVLQVITNMINGLLEVLIAMAVLKPLDDMAGGKVISDWTKHFMPQLVNAIMVIILRGLVLLVSFTPFILVVIMNASSIVMLRNTQYGGIALGGGILLAILTLLLGFLLSMILNFLLTFLEIEVVLGGGGILQAGVRSAKLVVKNLADIIIYSFLWFAISIGVGILAILLACTCILLPLVFIIGPLIVSPINLLSKVILWKSLKGSS